MLSQTVEYALRAMVCLAQNPTEPLTTQQISNYTRVPRSYTSKVLQLLGRAKLISGTRGIGGGYILELRPKDITVLQVANAIDPVKRYTTCPIGLGSHDKGLCPLHARLDSIMADAERALRNTTIASLLVSATHRHPLCEGPPVQVGRRLRRGD
jgi:Rrf2 family nitric oxide-sensitive transcriptional repressor